jgi:colicin import membrane protein
MNENKELIVLEKFDAVKLFTEEKYLDPILGLIEQKAFEIAKEASLESPTKRKLYATAAYQVAKLKVKMDGLGKDLGSDYREKLKKIDVTRKTIRDFSEDLQGRVRQPLTEWEEAEKERIERERLQAEFDADHENALADHAIWVRMKELEAKEAELNRLEEERKAKEEAERLEKERLEAEKRAKEEAERKEKERVEREKRIAAEAAEKAAREAKERIEKAEREKKEVIEKAERDRIAAIERAKIEKEME